MFKHSPVLYAAIASQFLLLPLSLQAQGTLDDYRRAYSIYGTYNGKMKGTTADVRWTAPDRFTYRVDGTTHRAYINPEGRLVIDDPADTVQAERQQRDPWAQYRGAGNRQRRQVTFTNRRQQQRHWMETDDERDADPILSPDSQLVAFVRNDNVWVAKPNGADARPISTDGTKSHYFSSYIRWSPDGRYVAAYRLRPIEKRYVYYVESSPADQLQPILHKQEYAKPGDELAQKTLYLIEVATGRVMKADNTLFPNQYSLDNIRWNEAGDAITFEYNERGHKAYRVLEMSAKTGQVRTLIDEQFSTYVNYSAYHYRHDFDDGKRTLWMSERDGYAHLYLYNFDPKAPKPKKQAPTTYISTWRGNPMGAFQVTRGQWVVRRVLRVDEERGHIYFTACGVNKDEDPYNIHYYRIGLDGKGLTDLTPAPGNHSAQFNEDYTYLIDTYSTPEVPPVTVWRSVAAPTNATTLAKADISALLATGWQRPEVFVAPGRDGATPMYGVICRPSNFDPSHKYPVIEYIYSGPGDAYTPKTFSAFNWNMTALAELGFIVVQLDGMTTSHRGKAFEEVCYKNLKDAGFPDRIAWIKAAAQKYPYMDADNVGIYGCSAGGQESTAAVLFHGDFYKAAYSACGCHDNRMDKIWWNEQWMGYPVDSSYIESSNVENAYRLERPLMLVVGELDDNVDPASTMQVVSALQRANKPFELVVIPGAHHTMGESYGEHKRYDFFVKNLLGVEPPKWSELEKR